ncbi:superfamily II DNA or RNA helicase [Paenibacillus sp. V4I3]|uniref:DEAD/DEAH box helicase n=1 Tax=Paenibacillus sp. V4I3 TaxID=3042305 RepID=UPI00278313E1|nr:SNF2-related protein [Paenibacillus sp. V4I3]MDQ0878972.1 superfamily II DNA or RNA helicase [Paenibacillus sp. V4I3]
MVEPKFTIGQNVKIITTGKIGTVNRVLNRSEQIGYQITVEGKTQTFLEKYLEPIFDVEQEVHDHLFLGQVGGPFEYQLFDRWFRFKRPNENGFYSYLASRTLFNPFQFKPLSKFISPGSEERLFIADEVGVGKTIETGIIITEMIARGKLDRRRPILIVCPNTLGPKWANEMKKRFNFNFRIHDGKSLKNSLISALNGEFTDVDTWAIASIQLLRSTEYFELVEQIASVRETPLWSMIIIDEAHHMRNVNTLSNKLGNTLSGLTEMMLMLSATPLNLRDEDLYNQMHILNPAFFSTINSFDYMLEIIKILNSLRRSLFRGDSIESRKEIIQHLTLLKNGTLTEALASHDGLNLILERLNDSRPLQPDEIVRFDRLLESLSPLNHSFTRTLKREAFQHRVIRETVKLPVVLTAEEMNFYNKIINVLKDVFTLRGMNPATLGFISNMPKRMASSSLPAMKNYLKKCIDRNSVLVDEDLVNSRDPEDEENNDDDLTINNIELSNTTKNKLLELIHDSETISVPDSKYTQLVEFLNKILPTLENRRVLIFSSFLDTLKYLNEKLEAEGYKVGLISGQVPLTSNAQEIGRYEIIDAFEKSKFDILLSSEVGGEGLDFQFCQVLINYDLPYNPMRLEQRIGRIDRFGQKADKVMIVNMFLKGTLDEDIYNVLYERINLIEGSVGLLEPILGNQFLNLQNDLINGNLSPEQIKVRAKELELSIEQSKAEIERFETQRKELLGEEDFSKTIQKFEDMTDFITPSDASWLTGICLSFFRDCSYEVQDDERGEIKLSDDFINNLERFTRKPRNEGSFEELRYLLQGEKKYKVIFNGSLADLNKDHVFLPPFGYWTKFLLSELESIKKIERVFSLGIECADSFLLPKGHYFISLFEINLEGFKTGVELAAVPINLINNNIEKCDYRTLIKHLKLKPLIESETMDNEYDSYMLTDLARQELADSIEERLDVLRRENEYQVSVRTQTLQKACNVRITKINNLIHNYSEKCRFEGTEPKEEYLRLMQSQIKSELRRTSEKINAISQKLDVSAGITLVGIVILDVRTGDAG